MKKYVGIAAAIICIVTFVACGNKKEIELPKAENVTEIEIINHASTSAKKISDKNEIAKWISDIKDHAKGTNIESVNDQPTNIDTYLIIEFHHKDAEKDPSIAYLYQKGGSSYVEKPYAGIWKINQKTFNSISGLISEDNSVWDSSESADTSVGAEASYKPTVIVDGRIYEWVRNVGDVKLADMELLGEIKVSKGSLSEKISNEDENFSSNIYPVGAKIYRWDEQSILVEAEDVFSVCEMRVAG